MQIMMMVEFMDGFLSKNIYTLANVASNLKMN